MSTLQLFVQNVLSDKQKTFYRWLVVIFLKLLQLIQCQFWGSSL